MVSNHKFYDIFKEWAEGCAYSGKVTVLDDGTVEKLRRTGVITIDEADKVLTMEEKPAEPKSNWAVPPFYAYSREDLGLISKAVNEGACNVDAPGDFIAWLCKQSDVYAYMMPEKRYDIGNLQSYEEICASYRGIE